MLSVLIEFGFLLFIPLVLLLSYLYLAGLRGMLEGLEKGPKLALLTGVALLWLSAAPGPLAALGAFLGSLALAFVSFFDDVIQGIKSFFKNLGFRKVKEKLLKGCSDDVGCLFRYLFAWPALAAVAASTEAVAGPLTMFVMGYLVKPPKLEGKLSAFNKLVSIIMLLIAWSYAVINTLKNLVLPHWLLVQEYAISGEVSKLPLTARILAKLFGKEAAYLYVAALLALAVYTVLRVHEALRSEKRREVMTTVSPFVAYAVSMNKLGEPLTSIAYALGMTLAYFMRTKNVNIPGSSSTLDKLLDLFARIGEHILEYSVPLGPLRRLLR